jgi:hypothetical protein
MIGVTNDMRFQLRLPANQLLCQLQIINHAEV